MNGFEQDRAELKASDGSIALTPLASDPFEQDALASFSTPQMNGVFRVMYLNGPEFAQDLQRAHAEMDGVAKLEGYPNFSVAISVEKTGQSKLRFRYEGMDDGDAKVSFGLDLDQSYLPDFLSQLARFNRSSAYRLS